MLLDLDFDVSTDCATPAALAPEAQRKVEQFLFHEARLLDQRRLDDWLSLWTSDGMYWIPQQHGQQSPYDHISLAWEDKMLREVRVKRLTNARNWSQQPVTRTARLVGNVTAAGYDAAGSLVVHSVFQMTEWRKCEPRQWAGNMSHKLEAHGDSWRIRFKRVDLVNCEAVQESIQVFI